MLPMTGTDWIHDILAILDNLDLDMVLLNVLAIQGTMLLLLIGVYCRLKVNQHS